MSDPITDKECNELSIQVSLDGFSFYAKGERLRERTYNFKEPLSPEQCLEKIKTALTEEELLKTTFDNVNVVYCNELYTLVPKSLFDADKSAEYLKYNTKILSTDYIAHDYIETLELICVYIPFTNINNYFFECFGSFEYNHSITLKLDKLLGNLPLGNEPKIDIFIRKRHFDLVVHSGKQLKLCNTFDHSVPEDIAYHTLFCYEQLGLDPNKDALNIYGSLKEDSETYKLLYTYIRNVNLINEEVLFA